MSKIYNPTQLDGTPIKEMRLGDLLAPATDVLKASGLESITQRVTHTANGSDFFLEFSNGIPTGEIRAIFPEMDRDEMMAEGWRDISLIISLSFGKVAMTWRGHYFKEPVPLDVDLTIIQGNSGYLSDKLILADRRVEKPEISSFKEIILARMKSGDPKYAKPGDDYGNMSFTRIYTVINRFLKDWTTSHRFIERD
jgi:hypothetical protein